MFVSEDALERWTRIGGRSGPSFAAAVEAGRWLMRAPAARTLRSASVPFRTDRAAGRFEWSRTRLLRRNGDPWYGPDAGTNAVYAVVDSILDVFLGPLPEDSFVHEGSVRVHLRHKCALYVESYCDDTAILDRRFYGWPALQVDAGPDVAAAAGPWARAVLGRAGEAAPGFDGATLPEPAVAFQGWAEALDPPERLGLALQHHGAVAGPLADPAVVLRIVPDGAAAMRLARDGARVRRVVTVGLTGLRRVLAAGLPLAGRGLGIGAPVVDLIDARPLAEDGLVRVRYVSRDGSGLAVGWGVAVRGRQDEPPTVHRGRDDVVRDRRRAAARVLDGFGAS